LELGIKWAERETLTRTSYLGGASFNPGLGVHASSKGFPKNRGTVVIAVADEPVKKMSGTDG
jgi:hypothetical protein